MSRHIDLPDEAATGILAKQLASTAPSPAVVYLHGDLGAGKSTLARAWLRTLGVLGPIKSPTYTLVERYRLPDGGEAAHLDLYRLAAAGELEFLALDELFDSARLWLVEWPDRGEGSLPAADLHVELAVSVDGRLACLRAGSEAGRAWLERLG